MPKIKSAVNRYHIIDACLTNSLKPYPSIEALAKVCSEKIREGISTSTIEKDIRQMKRPHPHGYDAPIEYSKQHRGYFYAEQGFSISDLKLSDEEWDGLRYAANLLHQYSDVPLFRDFKQAIEKINTRFNLMIDLEEDDFENYIQFETSNLTTGYHWIQEAYVALRNRWLLNIEYENIYKQETKKYVVYPKLLKEHRNRWYLVGWVEDRKDYLTFALDRIKQMQTNSTVQKHLFNFDPKVFLQHSVGIMETAEKAVKVVLMIKSPYHKLLELEPIHHSQKMSKQTENGAQIELSINVNHELVNTILAMGIYCKVVQPASLKNKIKAILSESLKYY
jgi:predicted DNA-binding transcriptional regulator YafY